MLYRGAGRGVGRRARGGRGGRTSGRPEGVRRQDPGEHRRAASSSCASSGGRVQVSVALEVAEAMLADASRGSRAFGGPPTRGRCDGCGDDRRRRPARGERGRRPVMERFTTLRRRSTGCSRTATTKSSIVTRLRAPGGPARDPARGLGRRDDLLHRLEGAQHPDPGDGGPQGAEAERVRARSTPKDGNAPRGRDARRASTSASACRTSSPRCGRTAARSRPRSRASCPTC